MKMMFRAINCKLHKFQLCICVVLKPKLQRKSTHRSATESALNNVYANLHRQTNHHNSSGIHCQTMIWMVWLYIFTLCAHVETLPPWLLGLKPPNALQISNALHRRKHHRIKHNYTYTHRHTHTHRHINPHAYVNHEPTHINHYYKYNYSRASCAICIVWGH